MSTEEVSSTARLDLTTKALTRVSAGQGLSIDGGRYWVWTS